jgi:hypothetical protein
MKNVIAIIIAALAFAGCTGLEPVPENEKTFSKVVEVKGKTKDQIYTATKIWIAENFKSAKSVIELDSKDDGIIIGNGIIKYPCDGFECVAKGDHRVLFTIRIDMKDERFRIVFSNIMLYWPASKSFPSYKGPVNLKSDMDAIRLALLQFGDDICTAVTSGGAKSDW